MTDDEILNRVEKILREQLNLADDCPVQLSSNMMELGADSLDVVEIAMALEEEFGIEILDEELEKIETVQGIITMLKTHNLA